MAHFTRKWSPADALLLSEVVFLQDLVATGVLELPVITTPQTPDIGYGKVYVKLDGSGNSALFFMSDDGTEIQLGQGGGGGGNGTVIGTTNTGDDQTYTLSSEPSSQHFVIMNSGSYSEDDLTYPYSISGTTLLFDNPLPSDL